MIQLKIGIIGFGGMGRLYASALIQKGYKVAAWDSGDVDYGSVKRAIDLKGLVQNSSVLVLSVPVMQMESVARELKELVNADHIVGSQSAVKTVEEKALTQYLGGRVRGLFGCHSLHSPRVSGQGQTMLFVPYRLLPDDHRAVSEILASTGSKIITLNQSAEHDRLMADVQVLTHLVFQSAFDSWLKWRANRKQVSILESELSQAILRMGARIFTGQAHVYGDIARMNPFSSQFIGEYRQVLSEIRELTKSGKLSGFLLNVKNYGATLWEKDPLLPKAFVSGWLGDEMKVSRGLDAVLKLALGSQVEVWRRLKLNPLSNPLAETPPYRLRVGLAEHLFREPKVFAGLISGVHDEEFLLSWESYVETVERWLTAVESLSVDLYEDGFQRVRRSIGNGLEKMSADSDQMLKDL